MGEGDGRAGEERESGEARGTCEWKRRGDGRAGEARETGERERRLGGRGVGKKREMGKMGEMGDGAEGGNGGDGGAGGWVRRVNGRGRPAPTKQNKKKWAGPSPLLKQMGNGYKCNKTKKVDLTLNYSCRRGWGALPRVEKGKECATPPYKMNKTVSSPTCRKDKNGVQSHLEKEHRGP